MTEWLIERGIGETRYALINDREIVEARIQIEGAIPAGSVIDARLTDAGASGRNAIATDERGIEYLIPRAVSGAAQGGTIVIEVTREAIPGSEPWKRPLARISDKAIEAAPKQRGRELSLPAAVDELGGAGWYDLIEEARSGIVRFAGGELRISPTPAMTLIDVDGSLPPEELVSAGAAAAARAIRRLDIGGSIGIDLPTVGGKAGRRRAAEAIDTILPQPFERTAVNGFGFVQIVRSRVRASLIELAQDRAAFEARTLLRRLAFEPAGAKRIAGHPAVVAALEQNPEWTERLARQIGGSVGLRTDARLPMSGGYAESA